MRSEIVPFETVIERWTEAHRITDVVTAPDEERKVVELACAPALVYEMGTEDWPESVSIYHGHLRLQMSIEEWDWLKNKGDAVIRVGRVNRETLPEDLRPRRLA